MQRCEESIGEVNERRRSFFCRSSDVFLSWWFQIFFMFTSKIGGRFSPILTVAYFSKGWFNHQLVFFFGERWRSCRWKSHDGSMGCLVYLPINGWLSFLVNVGKYTRQPWILWVWKSKPELRGSLAVYSLTKPRYFGVNIAWDHYDFSQVHTWQFCDRWPFWDGEFTRPELKVVFQWPRTFGEKVWSRRLNHLSFSLLVRKACYKQGSLNGTHL